MGRKRTINLNLPERMYARTRGEKTYYFLSIGGKNSKEISLGSDYIKAVAKWAELNEVPKKSKKTFKDLADLYILEALPKKAPRTQSDNIKELDFLFQFFNAPPVDFEQIKPKHIRQYLDWRGQKSPIRANREKALFSHMWNFARAKGLTDLENPCKGIKGFSEKGRDVYVSDKVFDLVYNCANQGLKDAMDLAYLTGQRPADVLKMTVGDIVDDHLFVRQNKTKAVLRIRLSNDDLSRNSLGILVDRIYARKKGYKVVDVALVCSRTGTRLTVYGLKNAFDKARLKAISETKNSELKEQIKNFQFKDLRAKAATDKADSSGIGEAQRQLGHATSTMTQHYVRLGNVVEPTK